MNFGRRTPSAHERQSSDAASRGNVSQELAGLRDSSQHFSEQSRQEVSHILQDVPPSILEMYYGSGSHPDVSEDQTGNLVELVLSLSIPGSFRDAFQQQSIAPGTTNAPSELIPQGAANQMMQMEIRVRQAFCAHSNDFPLSIWTCCSRACFSCLIADGQNLSLLDEILRIHRIAEKLHRRIGIIPNIVQTRLRGVGGSSVGFSAPSRFERDPNQSTDRQAALRELRLFVIEVLPFLRGQQDAPSGTPRPRRKLCTEAICCLLGVSKNFLYVRAVKSTRTPPADSIQELSSIVDTAGVRLRQHRRCGSRLGFPEIGDLPQFDCGCDEPCLASVPVWRLHSEYNEFSSLAQRLKPRRKENRYLLNVMFCPLLNSTLKVCDKALANLYTVSIQVIEDVRMVLDKMCTDPSLDDRVILRDGVEGYKKHGNHPMNRYPDAVREKIEVHLDMILRADPGASDGVNTCRVYSPEVNTQEKLRKVLAMHLEEDSEDVHLSSSTLQRMIEEYLRSRNCRIRFTQSDHNACPNCKTLQYAILQFSFDIKALKAKRDSIDQGPLPLTRCSYESLLSVQKDLEIKMFQESTALDDLSQHNNRDARIRKLLKNLTDYFRAVEKSYQELDSRQNSFGQEVSHGWRDRPHHAIITHQDDMSKVDLPSFVQTASSDITRWRYDVNAHVNAVNEDCTVFSHEQGSGPKNSSSIMELIVLDHILRCKGEGIKFIVSDNAAVGKNWTTVVAMPQYFVDQGLAEIVVVVFLENNHGKWLADMLFGQLQTRRKRATLISIDSLLAEFEHINRKSGSVQGYAVNPLSCIDFVAVLESLGYETSPPKDFGFLKRDIHFSAACRPGAKQRMPAELRNMIGEMLPSKAGMVRLCSDTPATCAQTELPYEKRYLDVPAVSHSTLDSRRHDVQSRNAGASVNLNGNPHVPLVVPLDKEYAPSGSGVVSQRNMTHVGYNGIEFRKLSACPELHNANDPIVQEAWPPGLLTLRASQSEEPVVGSESVKCAPMNWVVRRPISRFHTPGAIRARYPPQNMLNAKFKRAPRASHDWLPTSTYSEPPFPISPETSAYPALCELQSAHTDISESLNILEVLKLIFKNMGDRYGFVDPWWQKFATRPSDESIQQYKQELAIFKERERDHPSAPLTLRNAFHKDQTVLEEVETRLQVAASLPNAAASGASRGSVNKRRTQISKQLFEETSLRPGGLDKYTALVTKDLERYSKELKSFKEVVQQTFDREHGLLPLSSQISNVSADGDLAEGSMAA